MDSTTTVICESELIMNGHSVSDARRQRATTPAPFASLARLINERNTAAGQDLLAPPAACWQGAQLTVETTKQQSIAHQIAPITVMGGSYVADDAFGTRWGSKPGRPPE